jgi:uncharacterized protein (UPF0276 family)
MSEAEFICRMAEEADCGLLLDVNNVYVSSFNHDLDPEAFIRSLPHDRIVQFHLAGHTNYGEYLLDTHDGPVIHPVWNLYSVAHELTGGAATLLEWDASVPEFSRVHEEVLKGREFMTHQERRSTLTQDVIPANPALTVFHPLHQIQPEVE